MMREQLGTNKVERFAQCNRVQFRLHCGEAAIRTTIDGMDANMQRIAQLAAGTVNLIRTGLNPGPGDPSGILVRAWRVFAGVGAILLFVVVPFFYIVREISGR
jgi:hypothetical protein